MADTGRTTDRTTIGATRARQGRRGVGMMWVLLIGLALVILGFAITWALQPAGVSPATSGGQQKITQSSDASGFQAPRPDAASRQNYQKGGPLAPKNGGNPE